MKFKVIQVSDEWVLIPEGETPETMTLDDLKDSTFDLNGKILSAEEFLGMVDPSKLRRIDLPAETTEAASREQVLQWARKAATVKEIQRVSREAGKTVRNNSNRVGRNDACPCGSGKKFKKCHGRTI